MWNLVVVGLGLASCGVAPEPNAEGQSTSTGTDGTTGKWTTTTGLQDDDGNDYADNYSDGDEEGCDCPEYWFCLSGVCYPPDCYYDQDCGLFQECVFHDCESVGHPPPPCELGLLDIPAEIQLDGPALALSFIDLDDDGRDHLVVATQTELLLYEFGVDTPTVVPRNSSSSVVQSMVAGHFDDQPGEDLVMLVNPHTHRYFSGGAANLVNPSIVLIPDSNGIFAGDFDGQPPTDLLHWGPTAGLYLNAMPLMLTDHYTKGAAFLPLGSSSPGLALNTGSDRSNEVIAIFNLMGNIAAQQLELPIDGPLVAIEAPNEASYVGSWLTEGGGEGPWSSLKRLDPNTGEHTDTLFAAGVPKLAAADIDGDLYDELIACEGSCTVIFGPLGNPCQLEVEVGLDGYVIEEFAVGDHDGDADEEVALRSSDDRVFIFNGE